MNPEPILGKRPECFPKRFWKSDNEKIKETSPIKPIKNSHLEPLPVSLVAPKA